MARIFAGADWSHPQTFAVWYEDQKTEMVLAREKTFAEDDRKARMFMEIYKKGGKLIPERSV